MRATIDPGCLAAAATELSLTTSLGVGVVSSHLFQGGMSASGMSALRIVDGAGNGIGKGRKNGGNGDDIGGSGDGGKCTGGLVGGGSIWESGNDNKVSGDGGGVGKARSLATSASEGNGIGVWVQTNILEVVRYAGGGGGVAADSLVSKGSVSSADGP
ncbi:hypothetical protein Tco_0789624 [Tanacetum coccineum]